MMQIRRARVDDARGIASIHVCAWQAAYQGIVPDDFLDALSVDEREARWLEALTHGTSEVWVAADNAEIVGWVSVGRSRDEDSTPTTAELWAIYVRPTHWRRGVGRALWAQAVQHLLAAGFHEITLWVLDQNEAGLRFYGRLGFRADTDQKTIKLGGAELLEIRLRCPLGGDTSVLDVPDKRS